MQRAENNLAVSNASCWMHEIGSRVHHIIGINRQPEPKDKNLNITVRSAHHPGNQIPQFVARPKALGKNLPDYCNVAR